MFKILSKRRLNPTMTWLVIDAPLVAKKARPGQFIILRTDEYGERIPLTMVGHDAEKGTIDLIYAAVGRTTMLMDQLEEGDYLLDVVGPLGKPTHMEGLKRVAVVGGGTGNALAYPLATGMHKEGIHVDMIAGFKNKEMVILEDEFKAGTDRLFLTTDDGSYGEKGFTTDKLKELIEAHGGKNLAAVSANVDFLVAGEKIGPAKLQKATKLGVRLISEEELLAMIASGGTLPVTENASDGNTSAAPPSAQETTDKTDGGNTEQGSLF